MSSAGPGGPSPVGALGAITSKLWLSIGPIGDPNNLKPALFMNLGPWMSLEAYLVQLGALVIVAAILAAFVWGVPRTVGRGAPAAT